MGQGRGRVGAGRAPRLGVRACPAVAAPLPLSRRSGVDPSGSGRAPCSSDTPMKERGKRPSARSPPPPAAGLAAASRRGEAVRRPRAAPADASRGGAAGSLPLYSGSPAGGGQVGSKASAQRWVSTCWLQGGVTCRRPAVKAGPLPGWSRTRLRPDRGGQPLASGVAPQVSAGHHAPASQLLGFGHGGSEAGAQAERRGQAAAAGGGSREAGGGGGGGGGAQDGQGGQRRSAGHQAGCMGRQGAAERAGWAPGGRTRVQGPLPGWPLALSWPGSSPGSGSARSSGKGQHGSIECGRGRGRRRRGLPPALGWRRICVRAPAATYSCPLLSLRLRRSCNAVDGTQALELAPLSLSRRAAAAVLLARGQHRVRSCESWGWAGAGQSLLAQQPAEEMGGVAARCPPSQPPRRAGCCGEAAPAPARAKAAAAGAAVVRRPARVQPRYPPSRREPFPGGGRELRLNCNRAAGRAQELGLVQGEAELQMWTINWRPSSPTAEAGRQPAGRTPSAQRCGRPHVRQDGASSAALTSSLAGCGGPDGSGGAWHTRSPSSCALVERALRRHPLCNLGESGDG